MYNAISNLANCAAVVDDVRILRAPMSMVESQLAYSDARLIVIMGSGGCGKSTVGRALAAQMGVAYIEGDDFHPPENKAKMSACTPLTDDDRWPWLAQVGELMHSQRGKTIVSCSALKRTYREFLTKTANEPVLFVYLHAQKALLLERVSKRKGHFMDIGLLDDQIATLEKPSADEFSIKVDADTTVDNIVQTIISIVDLKPDGTR